MQFGIAGGLNWAGLGDVEFGSATAAYESQQGWHVGAFLDLRLLVVGIKPGVYYTNAGKLFSGDMTDDLTEFDVTYISIPVDVTIGIPLPFLNPYIFAGPEFKINTVSEDDGELASQLESTVIAGNIGFGVGISLGGAKLYPELRLGFGLTSFLGDTVTIGGEDIPVDTHSANSFVARLGIGI